MYGFGGVGLSEVQISISELSVVGGWWTGQTHFMVGPGRGPTKTHLSLDGMYNKPTIMQMTSFDLSKMLWRAFAPLCL